MVRQSPVDQGFAQPFQPHISVSTYSYANQLGPFSPYNQPVRTAFNNLLAHDWSDASVQLPRLSVGPQYGSSPKQSPLVSSCSFPSASSLLLSLPWS